MDPLNLEFARLLALSGWSKSEVARRLELSPASITQYLSGETRPSLTTIKLLKLLLGDLSPLPGTKEPLELVIRQEFSSGIEEWESALLLALRRLSDEDRRTVARHFQGILELVPGGKGAAYKKRRSK